MQKKIYLVIMIYSFIGSLHGLSYIIDGIHKRGIYEVNYGRVIFPLSVSIIAFVLYRRKK